jgi:hypothetical protein
MVWFSCRMGCYACWSNSQSHNRCCFCLIFFIILFSFSFLFAGKSENVDPTLTIPVFTRFCPCLPSWILRCCECGYIFRVIFWGVNHFWLVLFIYLFFIFFGLKRTKSAVSIDEDDEDFITRMVVKSQENIDNERISNDVKDKIEELGKNNQAFVSSNLVVTKF